MKQAMAGKSSSSNPGNTRQQEKRMPGAAATVRGHAKKPRPSSQPRNGAAVPVAPLQAPSTNAMALAFPMAGVNGAAPRWSTAAALGAAGRAAAAAAVPLPETAAAANVPAGPFVLVPAPAAGVALAAALRGFNNGTLGRMLADLMPACRPPLRLHENKAGGTPPPWWPTGTEPWWAPEVAAHLGTLVAEDPPVPFVAGNGLRKHQRVAVLVAIVKHLAPDFSRVAAAASRCGLSDTEAVLWSSGLGNECIKCGARPVFILPQPAHHDGGRRPAPAPASLTDVAATKSAVHGGAAAGSDDGCEQAGNPGATPVTTAPSDGGEVVAAAAEPAKPEQDDGVPHGGNVAADPLGAIVTAAVEPEQHPEQDAGVMVIEFDAADQEKLLEDMLSVEQGEEARQAADIEASGGAAAAATEEMLPVDHIWVYDDELHSMFAGTDMPPPLV